IGTTHRDEPYRTGCAVITDAPRGVTTNGEKRTSPPPVLGSGPRAMRTRVLRSKTGPHQTERFSANVPRATRARRDEKTTSNGETAGGERDPLRRSRHRQRLLRHPHHPLRDRSPGP